jgi:hypothetical protein
VNPFSGFANLFSGFWIENIDTELVETGLCRIKDEGWTIRGLMGCLLHKCAWNLQLGFLFQLSFARWKDFKMGQSPQLAPASQIIPKTFQHPQNKGSLMIPQTLRNLTH